jgi:hypothetical protein
MIAQAFEVVPLFVRANAELTIVNSKGPSPAHFFAAMTNLSLRKTLQKIV